MDIVIGAGISGLAYSLFSPNETLILEASSEIGGYCKTTKRNGYVWDYSGHFFHFNDKEIESLITRNLSQQSYAIDRCEIEKSDCSLAVNEKEYYNWGFIWNKIFRHDYIEFERKLFPCLL